MKIHGKSGVTRSSTRYSHLRAIRHSPMAKTDGYCILVTEELRKGIEILDVVRIPLVARYLVSGGYQANEVRRWRPTG